VDRGGPLDEREAFLAREAAVRRPLPLKQYCYSSCTMLLADVDACVRPDARVFFHASTFIGTRTISVRGNARMMASYWRFPRLQARLAASGALATIEYTEISGAELIGLGVARCAHS